MPFNPGHVDLLLQYALLVAGEDDEYFDRQLGPIHLIKYVYLADLAYARRNEGKTFTGVDWRFYKFGPWSQAVNERIEPALLAIRADKQAFPSDYGDKDDWVRWSLRDDRLLNEIERKIPSSISFPIKRDIHKFGKDTPSLLDYVYSTPPMLSAAPNEHLDFSFVAERSIAGEADSQQLRMDGLSNKKKKKFKEKMLALREQRNSRAPKIPKLVNPVKHARYDEVFDAGVAWLDDLAGPALTTEEIVAEFSDEVWKSLTRKGEDVS